MVVIRCDSGCLLLQNELQALRIKPSQMSFVLFWQRPQEITRCAFNYLNDLFLSSAAHRPTHSDQSCIYSGRTVTSSYRDSDHHKLRSRQDSTAPTLYQSLCSSSVRRPVSLQQFTLYLVRYVVSQCFCILKLKKAKKHFSLVVQLCCFFFFFSSQAPICFFLSPLSCWDVTLISSTELCEPCGSSLV